MDLEVWWFRFYQMVLHCTSPVDQKSILIFNTRFSSDLLRTSTLPPTYPPHSSILPPSPKYLPHSSTLLHTSLPLSLIFYFLPISLILLLYLILIPLIPHLYFLYLILSPTYIYLTSWLYTNLLALYIFIRPSTDLLKAGFTGAAVPNIFSLMFST